MTSNATQILGVRPYWPLTKDVPAARKFYVDQLGFADFRERDFVAGGGGKVKSGAISPTFNLVEGGAVLAAEVLAWPSTSALIAAPKPEH